MDEKDRNLLVYPPFEGHMKFSRLYPTQNIEEVASFHCNAAKTRGAFEEP